MTTYQDTKPWIILNSAVISLALGFNKNNHNGVISACRFNGIHAQYYRVIAAETALDKKSENAYKVVRCSFENCTTRREDKKLVLTTGEYLGAFKKWREITVLTISDCVGLDSVKQLDAQSGSYERAKPYELKTKTVLGELIGCEEPELPARAPGVLSVIFL